MTRHRVAEYSITSSRPSSDYIPTLDGWRCIAISLVLFAHSCAWLGFGTAKLARWLHYPAITLHIGRAGLTGVIVFFCISGFLITRRLIDQGISLRDFYIRRAFRILPPALVYLTVIALLGLFKLITVDPRQIVAALFFWRNYLDDSNAFYTGHFWSLSIEEQFYMIWPLLLRWTGVTSARVFASLGIVGVVTWRHLHFPLSPFAYFYTEMRLDAILCGSLMALSWQTIKPVAQKASAVVMLAVLVGFWAADLWSVELQGTAELIQAVLICSLIAMTVANPVWSVSRILETRAITWVGRLSYSIYLWQQLFFMPAQTARWQLPFRFVGIIGLAWLSYTFVERPLIAVGRRLIDSTRSGDKSSPSHSV